MIGNGIICLLIFLLTPSHPLAGCTPCSYPYFMFFVVISQVNDYYHDKDRTEIWRIPETWKAINRTQIQFEYCKIYSIYTVQTTNRKWIIRWGGTKMIEVKWIYASILYIFSVCHVQQYANINKHNDFSALAFCFIVVFRDLDTLTKKFSNSKTIDFIVVSGLLFVCIKKIRFSHTHTNTHFFDVLLFNSAVNIHLKCEDKLDIPSIFKSY